MKRLLFSAITLFALAWSTASANDKFTFGTKANPQGDTFEVDSKGFIINGKHTLPVMGEIHYARVPQSDWRREIRKMKAGGITIIATYVFWIHHEPKEGVWNWSGNRNLHAFLQVCKEEQMPVVLRIGPFCHGEVFQGGIPKWTVLKAQANPKEYKLRSNAPGFLASVRRLYSNIFAQANDMLWKHGGPIVGVQLENECRGPWSYYMNLKNIAVEVGFDTPFYTRTGWPKLNGREEFGKMLPLYGDYADGFWDRSLKDMPGDYPKAFLMKDTRVSAVIATETFGSNQDTKMEKKDLEYPYLTCELGGGMMPSYHRRINMSGNEALPLAVCKVGSGSNLPGYYMYHGGTNPHPDPLLGIYTWAETQRSPVTNYNDMPVMSYDFQSQLGEMGQPNDNAFHQTRLFHQFLADWGSELALMPVDTLSDHYARRGCFEFYNDYVRILNEQGISYVRPVDMPFGGHAITADAQPFCHIGDTLYLLPIKGMKPTVKVDARTYRLKPGKPVNVKAKGRVKDLDRDIVVCLLDIVTARRAYKIDGRLHYAKHDGGILYKDNGKIVEEYWDYERPERIVYSQTKQAAEPRTVKMGQQKVAAMPVDEDFDAAAVWELAVGSLQLDGHPDDYFLRVDYAGDCARMYLDGELVADNFWNGKPMLVRLEDVVGGKVELRILPLRKDAPIYLQKEQRAELEAASGNVLLNLKNISLVKRTMH